MLTIHAHNTLTGRKELIESGRNGTISLYVCGITPYDHAHVGHARVYVTFDVLYRLLQFYGYNVLYCRNFTDIDDKIIKKAEAMYNDPMRYSDVATVYMRSFHQDMDALNCMRPTFEPLVTENIPAIIDFISRLIEAGHAYVVDGDVYYAVQSFPDYGKLSKRKLDQMNIGARVEPNEKKRYPLDFALWKGEDRDLFWKSPWGYGRPGWHIECSALAKTYLGSSLDIHAGGLDLIFPHHENEIAQYEPIYGVPFARYWMHNGFVQVNQEKMSKSLGNFFTLRDVFDQFHPHVIRYYLLSHHYRAPLEFSYDDIKVAERSYKRICRSFQTVSANHTVSDEEIANNDKVQKMLNFINDDLNVQGAFGFLFEHLSALSSADDAPYVKFFIEKVLGLPLELLPEHELVMTEEIVALMAEREHARDRKDWKRADELRDQLKSLGIDVQDKKK